MLLAYIVNPVPAIFEPTESWANNGKYLWSAAVWSEVVLSASTESRTALEKPVCPVTTTLASLDPGNAPKSIVAVPIVGLPPAGGVANVPSPRRNVVVLFGGLGTKPLTVAEQSATAIVIAGVVVAVATVPDIGPDVVTDTVVTVPKLAVAPDAIPSSFNLSSALILPGSSVVAESMLITGVFPPLEFIGDEPETPVTPDVIDVVNTRISSHVPGDPDSVQTHPKMT